MQILFLILLFILGAAIGSFLCCQARRLHLKDTKKSKLGHRSVCLKCKKQLKWYDNVPIISWLMLKGKCRHCHHRIGAAEIISELSCAFAFLAIGTTINLQTATPLEWGTFAAVIIFTTTLCFLGIYDGLYGELPTALLIGIQFLAAIIIALRQTLALSSGDQTWNIALMSLAGGAILGGLYLVLYLVSKGKWVGDGDWLLALAIGLVLGSPWLAVVALFLANFSATVIMYPSIKKKDSHRFHFGPFLVFAFVVTFALANILESML